MRYVAIIPAVGLVVALLAILIGGPFSVEHRDDSSTFTPPVTSIAGPPSDEPAARSATVISATAPAVADDERNPNESIAVEPVAATGAGNADDDMQSGIPTDAATFSRPVVEEAGAAEISEAEEICRPVVPRNRRPGRRFGRCR